jgi:NitT/TauT family transport system permease protein
MSTAKATLSGAAAAEYLPRSPARMLMPAQASTSADPIAQLIQRPVRAKPAQKSKPRSATMSKLRNWSQTSLCQWLLGLVSISAVLLFWYVATRYKLDFYIRFNNIPTPGDVFHKIIEVNQSTKFLNNVGISVRRILLGFMVATVLAVILGIAIGRYRVMRAVCMPALEVFRPIPAIAWVPMSIMLWPSNEVSIVFITFLGAFFPILLNTIHGVESIDPVLIRAARSLGAKEPRLLISVIFPAVLPHVFTGLAVGMGVAWVSLIAAEMISGQFGVGYFTWEAYSLISYAEIALGMITIGLLGLMCSSAIRTTGRLCMPWQAYGASGRKS